MRKALIIYNPKAGIKIGDSIVKLAKNRLEILGYAVSIFFLNSDFEKNILFYDFSSVKLVAAIGGDGTVKVAARTILQKNPQVELAIIPFGSTNVVAQTLGLPLNAKKALKLLGGAKTRNIDVGLINDQHYFLVGLAAGYAAGVVAGTPVKLKNWLGFVGYFISLFLNSLHLKRNKFLILTGQRRWWLKGHSLIIFNACNFFGFKPRQPIDPADGILNLYVITNKNFWTLLLAVFNFLFYHRPPQYVFSLNHKSFRIRFDKKIKTALIDGDALNLPREITVKILPRALKVVVGE